MTQDPTLPDRPRSPGAAPVAEQAAATPEPPPRAPSRGGAVGRYVLLEPIGAGGMGEVWSAYDPELDRKIAVKLVMPIGTVGDRRDPARSRLLREARSMARLAHPNVITVHDVGTVDERVFIAMELVEGPTLEAWLAAAPRPWPQVLERFLAAGRGLAAAHAVGLVHRDFKPANVLVGSDERVRVLDFGLARSGDQVAVAEESAATPGAATVDGERGFSGQTAPGVMAGTLRYMAPEQLRGDEVDARSDQFNFAVALYEALYGQAPFPGRSAVARLASLESGSVPTPPPSSEVPAQLFPVLARALAVAPAARYATLDEMLAALAAVPARIRRRRLIGSAIVLAAAVAVAASAAWRWAAADPCAGVAARLEAVWSSEHKAAVRAALVGSGLPFAERSWRAVEASLDRWASDWRTAAGDACRATLVRHEQSETLYDLEMACLERHLGELEAVVAVLAAAAPELVARAPDAAGGLPDLAECSDTTSLLAVVRPPDAATSARVQALHRELAAVSALRRTGRRQEAVAGAEQATAAAAELGYQPLLAEANLFLAELSEELGRADDASGAFLAAAGAAERGRDDRAAARAFIGLAAITGTRQVDFPQGERWLRMAEAKVARVGGDAMLSASLASRWGVTLHQQGRPAESLTWHQRALELRRSVLGDADLGVAVSHTNLGAALVDLGRYAEAETHFNDALSRYERALGPDHPKLGPPLLNLGNLNASTGRGREAEAAYRRVVALYRAAYGADYAGIATALTNLSGVVAGRDADEALRLLDEALAIKRRSLRPNHPGIGFTLVTRGRTLADAGRRDEAERDLRSGLALLEAGLGERHPDLVAPLSELAELAAARGRGSEAVALAERALMVAEAGASDPGEVAATRFLLARVLVTSNGDRGRATALAAAARADLVSDPEASEEVAKIDAWLAERR